MYFRGLFKILTKKSGTLILLLLMHFPAFSQVLFPAHNYQDAMLSYVKTFLPSDPVILEAGGNCGEDTVRMKHKWHDATIHVFEPLPNSFKKLISLTENLPSVFCYQYALTSFVGITDFYVNVPNNAASSIGYPVSWNEYSFDKIPIQVLCTTIHEWAIVNNVSKIDFMWLDMEGHELYALQHAQNILSTVKAIYTEISFEPIRIGSCSYTDLRNFLESEGFDEVWKSSDGGRFGDALFIKR